MRPTAWTWPFPFGVRLGWATAAAPNRDLHTALGRVYLLRGQGLVFSPGFGKLCTRLRRAGFWAEDLRCVGDRWVRRQLIADHRTGKLHGPIIFVGHSCGGRYALFTAQKLAEHGIDVDLLICVDVAIPYPVAANVRRALHLYRSQRRLYPARPLCRAPGSLADITNVDLDAENSPMSPLGLHHLNITANSAVQDWIVTRVREIVGRGDG